MLQWSLKINATRSEESQTPLNQRAFKRTAKEASTWSQIIFDSYTKTSGKRTTSWKHHLKMQHGIVTSSLFGKWEPKGSQSTQASWVMSGEYVS